MAVGRRGSLGLGHGLKEPYIVRIWPITAISARARFLVSWTGLEKQSSVCWGILNSAAVSLFLGRLSRQS